MNPTPFDRTKALLALVAGLRQQLKRSPGMSAGPFSDEGLALIEELAKDSVRYRFIREFNEESQAALFGKDGNDEMPWGIALDEAVDKALIDRRVMPRRTNE